MGERRRIGAREVEQLGPQQVIWDASLRGFGARRQAGSAVSYFVMFRTKEGRLRRYTIGRHGAPWTPDLARTKALAVLTEAKVKGRDPAAQKRAFREAETVNDLCDRYWHDAEHGRLLTRRRVPKKASTLLSDKGRIDWHIRPLLGKFKVAAVIRSDIEEFMNAVAEGKTRARKPTGKKRGLSNVRGGRGAASRTVGLLGAIFSYAVRNGMRQDNPVHGVMRPADGRRERRLSNDEYAALGKALRQAQQEAIWPRAIACVWFLALTGWRSGEALALRQPDVDLKKQTAVLEDTKTGRSVRPLASAACGVVRDMQLYAHISPLVFPSSRGKGAMSGFANIWERIANLVKLPRDITPHTLRHSFASVAADLGYSEPTIGALIGHKGHSTTSRYIHGADSVLLAAADKVAEQISGLMGERPDPSLHAPPTGKTNRVTRGHAVPRGATGEAKVSGEELGGIETEGAGGIHAWFRRRLPPAFHAGGPAYDLDFAFDAYLDSAVAEADAPVEARQRRCELTGELDGLQAARDSLFRDLAGFYRLENNRAAGGRSSKQLGRRSDGAPSILFVRDKISRKIEALLGDQDESVRALACHLQPLLELRNAKLGRLLDEGAPESAREHEFAKRIYGSSRVETKKRPGREPSGVPDFPRAALGPLLPGTCIDLGMSSEELLAEP